MVWLDTKNLFTKQLSRKLENRYAGKYWVKKIISNHVVELDLPSDLHIYLVFHINLLKLAVSDNPHPGHVQPPSLPIKVDKETKYEITAIVDFRLFGKIKKLRYRIQWIDYVEFNWKDALNITNAADLLHDFYSYYLNKLGLLS